MWDLRYVTRKQMWFVAGGRLGWTANILLKIL